MGTTSKSGDNGNGQHKAARVENATAHRRRTLRVLFIHRDADAIEACTRELERAQFTVSGDFVLNLAHCAERLHAQAYDVVIAEYPARVGKYRETRKRCSRRCKRRHWFL